MDEVGGNRRSLAATVIRGMALLAGMTLVVSGCLGTVTVVTPSVTPPATPAAVPSPRVTLGPERPSTSPSPLPSTRPAPSARSLSLGSVGAFPSDLLESLAKQLANEYALDIQVLTPSSLEPEAFDPARDQYVAEDLVSALIDAYPRPSAGDSVVIGILVEDLYIRDRPDWHWAFGVRDDAGYAVVSTARMGSLADPTAPTTLSRLRKMLRRDIGVLYFGLPLNDDPRSVLYGDVLSVDDLDRMGETFCGSACPGIAFVGEHRSN